MPEIKQDIGLSILTSSAVFGAWSAWNSSLFTASTFVDTPEKYQTAKLAMDLGLLTALATGAGVYYVYGEKGKVAAVSAIATGFVLYLAYYFKLRCNPSLQSVWSKNKSPQSISTWKSLTDEQLQEIRTLIDNSSIEIVSDP